jgi:hypothetical protein
LAASGVCVLRAGLIGVARRSIFAGAIRPILARMTMALRALLVAAAFVPRPIAAMSVSRRAAMRPTILRWPFGTAFNTEYGIDLRSDISVRPVPSASVCPRRVVVLAIAVRPGAAAPTRRSS